MGLNNSMELQGILEKIIVVHFFKKYSCRLEPEGSIPCSEEPASGSYPHMNPVYVKTPCYFKTNFNIILQFISVTFSQMQIFSSAL
jgi:hypothetical protein